MANLVARVDNRLLHGQILAAWVPATGARAILVLDDEAAGDELARGAMAIAVPAELTLEVAPVADAAQAVARAGDGVIVLLREVAGALRAVQQGFRPPRLDLGNVHFSSGRVPVSRSVYLSAQEVAMLEQVEAAGVPVELRTLPRDPPVGLAEIRRRVQGAPA